MRRPLCTLTPPHLYPPASHVIEDTQEALFDLENTLLRHGTDVEGNVGQGVGTSVASEYGDDTSWARPSYIEDPVRSPDPTISRDHNGHAEGSKCHGMPHPYTTCRNI